MRNRHLNIAVVFVWALAHGVWMGAGMHAFTELGGRADAAANKGGGSSLCASCVRFGASSTKTSLSENMTSADECAVCKLSTVLPEVSPIRSVVVGGALPIHTAPAALTETVRSFNANLFPLAHAPPV